MLVGGIGIGVAAALAAFVATAALRHKHAELSDIDLGDDEISVETEHRKHATKHRIHWPWFILFFLFGRLVDESGIIAWEHAEGIADLVIERPLAQIEFEVPRLLL